VKRNYKFGLCLLPALCSILLFACSLSQTEEEFEEETEEKEAGYSVVYQGNGATSGSVPVDTTHYKTGQTVTVLGNTGSLKKVGGYYLGWNTKADGSGTTYTQGKTFSIGSANVTLHAEWAVSASVDPAFSAGTGPSNVVNQIVFQSDGKLIVGGGFTTWNGTSSNHIVRIKVDGSIDSTFDPGSGANNNVNCIAIQDDGKILIAGYFTTYDGVAISRVARLNTDGTLDSSFDPGTGPNDAPTAMAVQSDGKILLVGEFTT